jgi:hypothetical protein
MESNMQQVELLEQIVVWSALYELCKLSNEESTGYVLRAWPDLHRPQNPDVAPTWARYYTTEQEARAGWEQLLYDLC